MPELRVIVGKGAFLPSSLPPTFLSSFSLLAHASVLLSPFARAGNHSPSHVAKIKPAITDLMAREHLTASLDPHNGGVLVVQLQGQGGGKGGGQFLRELEGSKDNDCVVM